MSGSLRTCNETAIHLLMNTVCYDFLFQSLGSQISELRSVVESLATLSVERRDDQTYSWPDKVLEISLVLL